MFLYLLSQKCAKGFELLFGVEIACLEDDVVVRRLDLALVFFLVILHILNVGGEERAVFDLPLFDFGVGYARAVYGDLSSDGFQGPGISHAPPGEEEQQHAAYNQNGRKDCRRENPQVADTKAEGKEGRNDNHSHAKGQVRPLVREDALRSVVETPLDAFERFVFHKSYRLVSFHGDKDSIKKQKYDHAVIFLLQIVKKTAESLLSASVAHIYRGNAFGESRHRGRRRKTFGMRVR